MNSKAPRIREVLYQLAKRGWITLRQMSPLLGYTYATGIYGRQRSSHPIATIRIGSTYRVYADVVIETLENAPDEDQEASQAMLSMYRTIKQEQENEQSVRTTVGRD